MFFKRKRRAKKGFLRRFFRASISIVILTAFVLGISLFIKEMSDFNIAKATDLSRPFLAKIGINPDVVGDVAGAVGERIFETNIAPSKNSTGQLDTSNIESGSSSIKKESANVPAKDTLVKIAVISDIHNDLEGLKKALDIAKKEKVTATFFLGDYTDLGVISNLEKVKEMIDASGLVYYTLPGDRDLYATSGPENYIQVYGEPNEVVTLEGVNFVLFNNSANFTEIAASEMAWFKNSVTNANFVFLSQPLYHPLNSVIAPIMGIYEGEEVDGVKDQADELLALIRNSNVKAVIAADQHRYSVSLDPIKNSLEHVVNGAVVDNSTNLSGPSMTILNVYKDMTYTHTESPL